MLKIYLARHGQDEDNAKGILNGHRDTPLTATGLAQAENLADHIKSTGLQFDKIYSSPLQRAYTTAEKVSGALGISKPEKYDLLIEREFGIMTGESKKNVVSLCAPHILITETIEYFLCPEGAETFPQVLERAKHALAHITRECPDGTALVVSHGDFGKMIYAAYYNLDWERVLRMFHFGNSELLLLSQDTRPENAHVFQALQHNN